MIQPTVITARPSARTLRRVKHIAARTLSNGRPLIEDPVRSRQILDRIPAGRWGQPEDLGGTVVFLCSSASDYLHGSVIAVDGGWLAR